MTDSNLMQPDLKISSDAFKQTESFLDWDQTVNKEDAINNSYFANESFKYVDEDTDNNNNILRETAGLGVEVGAGIGTEFLTTPLLAAGPFGILSYGVINFASGFSANVASQKAIRGEDNISWGEAIAAGGFQMIPGGATAKGVKGVAKSAGQAGVFAVGENAVRTAIDEQRPLTKEELRNSATVGAVFGTGFKLSIDGLPKVIDKFSKRFKGKSADEINQALTKTDVAELENLSNKIDEANSQINVNEIDKSVKTNNFNIDSDTGVIMGDGQFTLGMKVRAADRGNVGTVVGFNETTGEISVNFVSKQGTTLTKKFKANDLTSLNKKQNKNLTNESNQKLSGTLKEEQERIKNLKEGKKQTTQQPKLTKSKGKNIGDPEFTPNQINPEQVSNTNKQFDLIVNRVNELTDQGAFRGVKTFEDTIDGGIKLLANKKKLKRYAKTYAKLYGLQPTDELNYALAESVTFSVRKTSEINQDLISAINVSKDSQLIETKINELVDSIAEIDDWLRLSIPLRTEAGTALSAMRIPTQGLSAEEFAKLTPQGKYRLQNTGQTELSLDVSDQSLKLQDLKRNLLSALDTAKETGDYSAINKLTNTIKQSQIGGDSVETLSALYRSGILDRTLSSFNKGMRIFNEIGINALLSAPGTNEVNFVSGILETYTSAFELALGAGSRTELDAAIRHFMSLHSNLNFSMKAFKKSWQMSENYINRGSLKADYQERFVISSNDPGFVGKSIDTTGKIIRLPSQLMTSVDALVQSPNLIGHIHYQGHIEGVQLGKKGKELDDYVKGHVDAILEYYASNSGKSIKDPVTARILKRSQEFAKRSTFTEDIRTDGYVGFSEGAKILNQAANKIPLVRGVMAFVRTPTNIAKRQLRRTPGLSYLQKQLQNDLQSVDPGVRNQARGQVRLANALGLTLFTMGAASWVKPRDPNNPAGTILTGGGPDWTTKEGRAIWKNLYRNGWRPYSIGHLQKNQDGTPKFGEDGKPVYKYTSYERIDPLSSWIGLMVDFAHIAPWLRPDEYDEFTTGFVAAFSRNLIDRTYTRQIYEATQLFYDETKRGDFIARQLAARTPYANFIRYAKRMPDDILGALGVSEEDREYFNTKRDLKARRGDFVDEEGEEIVGAKDLRKLLNQMSETVPGMGGNLPLMYEHITDEPMLYPERLGPDLFSFVKKSTSKNNPIYTALIETGIQIREPSDVITGKATDSQIEPFKLTTTEYSELRKEINTIIPESQEYGNRNIKQAMTAFINSSFYKDNIKVIRKNGILNSPVAVNLLTKEFNKINNYYINEGEDAWIRKQPADTRNKQRNKKLEIYNKYNDEIQKIRALSSN